MIARSYANRGSLSLKRYGNPVLSCFCVKNYNIIKKRGDKCERNMERCDWI